MSTLKSEHEIKLIDKKENHSEQLFIKKTVIDF